MKQYRGIFIGALLAIAFSVFAFTEPTVGPPGGNVAAPINVSGTAQTKTGGLNIMGNVGIGMEKPENTLHVRGGQTWGTGVKLDATDVAQGKKWLLASTGGDAGQGQGKLVFYDDSAGLSILTIQGAGSGAGRVGIGVTAPTGRLDVVASDDWPIPTIAARGNIGHPNIQIKSDQAGSRDWRIISCGSSGCGPSGALRFFDNSANTDRVVIMPDGNVGIGTTQPGFPLTVAGKIYSSVGVDGESLCIKGDCKSSWSQVGGSGGWGFGGMYTLLWTGSGGPICSISNPITGGCSCPSGYTNSFVHRSYGCGNAFCSYVFDLYMCWK